MAKAKPDKEKDEKYRAAKRKEERKHHTPTERPPTLSPSVTGTKSKTKVTMDTDNPYTLLAQATALLQTSQAGPALLLATRALAHLERSSAASTSSAAAPLAALNLLAEIHIELGDVDAARTLYLRAVQLDPDGTVPEVEGGGAEKFLWLAQLCEEGGQESVRWFEKGASVLRREISALDSSGPRKRRTHDDVNNHNHDDDDDDDETNGSDDRYDAAEEEEAEKRTKLANALCGMVEVYMTDLSWESEAESRCETLITEALLVAPDTPGPLQTLASIRISQTKHAEATSALKDSMALWTDLDPEDPHVPDFATRVSLARLLLETALYPAAMEVLERLVNEDDQSVEAWYLGGWGLYLMGDAAAATRSTSSPSRPSPSAALPEEEGKTAANRPSPTTFVTTAKNAIYLRRSSRAWLTTALTLYAALEYEDEPLRDHAVELVASLAALGVGLDASEGEEGSEGSTDDEEVEDKDDDEDEDVDMVDGS
ncbi:MAG: hypothetical protein M1838_000647 [Thelocarpon superellum]|nr:MAG: hypothetical protein M1838_000647 [Thelocarpon superellum]